MRVLVALALLALPAAAPASAQPPPEAIFVEIAAGTSMAATLDQPDSTRAVVSGSRAVGMRLDRLFPPGRAPAARIQLDVSGDRWIARFERLDRDIAGFRSWIGTIEGIDHSHVVFTERDGVVSGLVNAVSTTYSLHTVRPGTYWLEQVDTSRLRSETDPLLPPDLPIRARSAQPARDAAVAAASDGVADDGSTIDVLVLYTPNARVRAGGTAQIQAMASQVIADSNTIFVRSGIVPRVRLVGTAEFGLSESITMATDLSALTTSAIAQSLRDSAGADLVQLLVSSPDPNACGIAWLLRSLTNTNFDAYSVADIVCLPQYTPTHELAHGMGAHHAPEDGAANGLYDYSYAFKDAQARFRTVMAYECSGGCPRIPNFSNPRLVVAGPPADLRAEVDVSMVTVSWRSAGESHTGDLMHDNALTINNTAATVARFRPQKSVSVQVPPSGAAAVPATSYVLQVGTAPGVANIFNQSVGAATTASGALWPGRYYWRVFSTNSGGASASVESQFTVTSAFCAPPSAPVNFAFSISGRSVSLTWLAPATGAAVSGYIIEAGSASHLADLYNAPTGRAFPNAVVEAPPGTYFVRIRAQSTCGTSAASDERVISVP